MHKVGRPSWRIGASVNPQLPHAALYIRDACALEVPADRTNPPRLLGIVADHSSALSSPDRVEAGSEWLGWWQEIVDFEGKNDRDGSEPRSDAREGSRSHLNAWGALLDWPTSDALGNSSAIRRAAQLCGSEPRQFRTSGKARPRTPDEEKAFHAAYSRIVDSLVARLGVSPDQLRAGIIVLGVESDWSAIALPGVLLCSTSVAQDVEKLSPLVEATFESGLNAN